MNIVDLAAHAAAIATGLSLVALPAYDIARARKKQPHRSKKHD